jgi:Mn-dependent DtxR family transcriptional regulator/Fe2+ transport system protein FeoA
MPSPEDELRALEGIKSSSFENYLLALYTVGEERGFPVKTTDIANWLKVAPGSVTEALQRMAGEGLIEYRPYRGASFTEEGRRIAIKVVRKHCIAERFLTDIIGVPVESVHEQAHLLEHGFTDHIEQEICRMLGRPIECPDDHIPIPKCFKPITCEECIAQGDWLLTGMPKGHSGTIQYIASEDETVVRDLIQIGLKPGREVVVKDLVEGTLIVGLEDRTVALGIVHASKVHVAPPGQVRQRLAFLRP